MTPVVVARHPLCRRPQCRGRVCLAGVRVVVGLAGVGERRCTVVALRPSRLLVINTEDGR